MKGEITMELYLIIGLLILTILMVIIYFIGESQMADLKDRLELSRKRADLAAEWFETELHKKHLIYKWLQDSELSEEEKEKIFKYINTIEEEL